MSKLNATVTSERGSKKQGGEFLDIEIRNSDNIVVAVIKVTPNQQVLNIWHDGKTEVHTHKDSAWNREIYDSPYQKSKSSKSNTLNCPRYNEKENECGMKNCTQIAEFNNLCDSHYRENRMS